MDQIKQVIVLLFVGVASFVIGAVLLARRVEAPPQTIPDSQNKDVRRDARSAKKSVRNANNTIVTPVPVTSPSVGTPTSMGEAEAPPLAPKRPPTLRRETRVAPSYTPSHVRASADRTANNTKKTRRPPAVHKMNVTADDNHDQRRSARPDPRKTEPKPRTAPTPREPANSNRPGHDDARPPKLQQKPSPGKSPSGQRSDRIQRGEAIDN